MKLRICIPALLLASLTTAGAQVASHAPTRMLWPPSATAPDAGKPVARVNGAVLTDHDLLREMYTIFPYARQHNGGVPKEMEPEIRSGAMQMIIFEELVYQEALRRGMTVPPAKLARAEEQFRRQFATPEEYQNFLKQEFRGSAQVLREKIRRSILIDTLLQREVESKSAVSVGEAKAYYDSHPARFEYPESFAIQTISILPPPNASGAQLKEMRKRAAEALRQAQATKNYEQFGVLAEKISDDDYRVMMGDHRAVGRAKLAPPVVQALLTMHPGEVSGIIPVEQAYTIVRLNQHIPAGTMKFPDVEAQLRQELQKKKRNELRAALGRKLRANARIEIL